LITLLFIAENHWNCRYSNNERRSEQA